MNKYEWDETKNRQNIIKHDISFEEAVTVFRDENAVTLYDKAHSDFEERFIIIGLNAAYMELAVCHCYRGENEDIIRIISARRATAAEKKIYERGY